MSFSELTDQTTYSFLFIVTPLEIISTKSIKNLKKSLLLKLGDKTQKTSQMNKPILIPLEVLYSKTLKKYCPIKGIIKVYDINADGSEVISSVGGFQTQQILNQQKTISIVQRDIGTSKVKMRIEIKNLGIVEHKHHKTEIPKGSQNEVLQSVYYSRLRTKQNIPQKQISTSQKNIALATNSSRSNQQNAQDHGKRQKSSSQYFRRSNNLNSPSILQAPKGLSTLKKDIGQFININNNIQQNKQKPSFSSRVSHQRDNQKKQQLDDLDKNQKNSVVQKSLINQQNSQQNFIQLKNQLQELKKQRGQTFVQFQKFAQCFESKSSKIWIDFNQKVKTLNWKYKSKQFQKVFDDLFSFILSELQKKSNNQYNLGLQVTQNSKLSQIAQNQVSILKEDPKLRMSDNMLLRTLQKQKASLQMKLKSRQQQCIQLQNRIKELQSFKRILREQNDYLKEKDETMQQIISQKENEIDNLKQQMTQIQLQFKEMQATLKNDACQIQELREQVSNLNETIETYREKYGDLKTIKNRALQNQLKECLIWIDQQTRQLEMSDFAQETQASHSHNVSEIIKNIQLQGTSREQMNSIKQELAGLIKRIDNFLAK